MMHAKLAVAVVIVAGVSTSWLAFARSAQDFPARAADVTIAFTEGTNFMAVASPDRQSIAIDVLGALWVVPLGGGDARRVTPDALDVRNPSWSPDGKSLAFQAYDDNAWHIFTVAVTGTPPRRITEGPFDDQDPDWSPDGQSIVFTSDRSDGTSTVWEVEAGTGAVRQLSRLTGSDPCWIVSPSSVRDVVFLGPPDPRLPKPLSSQPPAPPAWWVIGAGGREVLLDEVLPPQNRAQGIVSCASGRSIVGPVEPVRDDVEDVFPFRPQWISAAELLYTADGHIKRRRVNGPGTVIPFRAALTIHRTPYAKAHRALQLSTVQRVTGIVSPTVSPDGSAIAFVALGDLWLLPVGGGNPFQLTNDSSVELDPAWSSDGTRLAYASDRGGRMNLRIRNVRTGEDTPLPSDKDLIHGPAWSADGQLLAYQLGGHDLEIVDAADGSTRATHSAASAPGRPTWGTTSTGVGFGQLFPYTVGRGFPGGTNQLGVFSLIAKTQTPEALVIHHSAGDRQYGGPVWSPDGSQVAYISEGSLWTQPVGVNGKPLGDRTSIVSDMPSAPSWEGDSRHLVYLTTDGLRRADLDGRTPTAIPLDIGWVAPSPPDRVVIHAGALFDGRSSTLRRLVDIVVEDGRIREVTPHSDAQHAGRVIDAFDQTVMPGLIESAAQLDPAYGERLGRIWLAYGVTTVADQGNDAYVALEMRESYDAGKRLGPRVLTSGDALGGTRVIEPGGLAITSRLQLEAALSRAARLGNDFFSTTVRLPDQYQQLVIAAAHNRGLTVSSPQLLPAAAFGADRIAPLRDLNRRGATLRVSGRNITYRDVIDVIAKTGISFTPALGAEGAFRLLVGRNPALADDSRLALFPSDVADRVRGLPEVLRRMPSTALMAEEIKIATMGKTVAAVAAAGGIVIAGSDPAGSRRELGGEAIPYGLGLHAEIEQFVKLGMAPFAALQSATLRAAETLGVGDELGSIEPTKLADLLFVDGDPLEDIRALHNVRAVMRGGWYYDRRTLGIPQP